LTSTSSSEDPGKYYLLNYGDHAYFRTHLEKDTAEFLSKNLSKLPDALTRSLVWRSIQAMVKTFKIKSPVFVDYITNNLGKEDQSSIIKNVAMSAHIFSVTKIPDEDVSETLNKLFDFFYGLLLDSKDKEITQVVTGVTVGFANTKENIERVITWVEAGHVLDKEGNKAHEEGSDIDLATKHSVLRKVYDDSSFTDEQREKLATEILGDAQDDKTKNLKITLKALKHDK